MAAPKLLPALLGGLFIGVLSWLPFISSANVCCCLWVVCGGALATLLMQQNTPRPVTNGEGALVGLFAGLFGVAVWLVLTLASQLLFSRPIFDMAEFERATGGAEMSPEAREVLSNMTPMVILAIGAVVWTLCSSVFATIGGLVGVLIFRKKATEPPFGGPPPAGGGGTPVPPTFTPPTFTPPAPVVPPPPTFTPPTPPPPATPPASGALGGTASGEWVGDAPTILIPARGPVLPPAPPAPPPPAPPSGATPPPADREPESH